LKILITGGASGLGEAITRACAAEAGDQIYFTYHRSAESAGRLEAELPNCKGIASDFKSAPDVENLRERIAEIDIDVLVNNAYSGAFIQTHFHRTEPAAYLDGFVSNVIPTIGVTQAAIHCFRRKKQGRIITILSASLIDAPPVGASVYAATKAYLAELSRSWATENAKFNITANTVSPALMLTPFTSGIDERLIEQIRNEHPLKRLLTTGEVAEVVVFLCRASQQINGIDIPVNSGAGTR
jgi:NAD(P)-dependent dehydrogenase (short-subunit alcohol dehydrogenase family)